MTLKELYRIAKNKLSDILPEKDNDFRLEQVEYEDSNKTWKIVVSYLVENKNKNVPVLTHFAENFQYERVYKELIINEDKEVTGFYIYSPK